jgi:hypothetical protein
MKGYTVFNAEQCDGLPAHYATMAEPPALTPMQRLEAADLLSNEPGHLIAAVPGCTDEMIFRLHHHRPRFLGPEFRLRPLWAPAGSRRECGRKRAHVSSGVSHVLRPSGVKAQNPRFALLMSPALTR